MIEYNLDDPKFDRPVDWMMRRADENTPWNDIKHGRKKTEEEFLEWIDEKIYDDDWPDEIREPKVWYGLFDKTKNNYEHAGKIREDCNSAIIHDEREKARVKIPNGPRTLWKNYRNRLLNEKHFDSCSVINIENSCLKTLERLSSETEKEKPIKGMIVGNVQSGKTANMAGLIAMAADYEWNIVIVLTGTIESLRKQTQERLASDLKFDNTIKKIIPVDNCKKGDSLKADNFIGGTNTAIALISCLKVKSRLMDLIDWLQEEPSKVKNYRILVIDDEADQASINTADVYDEETNRKTINRLICNLVFCRDKNANSKSDSNFKSYYGAMNYVCYTATPYANLLNENWDESLYPHSFINTLSVSDDYIGPKQIFDKSDFDQKNLSIVRTVDTSDLKIIQDINKEKSDLIPKSLQDSILWFICSVAAMRYNGVCKPFSMLIHTDMKKNAHKGMDNALSEWFKENSNKIVTLCKEIYDREIQLVNLNDFKNAMPNYADLQDISDYPSFDSIKPYIEELAVKPTRIMTDKEAEKRYSRQIHICVDNSDYKRKPSPEDEYIRLAYPSSEESADLGFATAFIVIGGNTLARGVTLQGLVSSYFLRTSKQADTLMQMGRWFGYRKGYELYPRIWMLEKTEDTFEYLYDLDDDLREQIAKMSRIGASPSEYILTLKTSPYASFLLTAKNKMQMAVTAEVDYSGTTSQLVVFPSDKKALENNIKQTGMFLTALGNGHESVLNQNAYYWDNVAFDVIEKNFFNSNFIISSNSRVFQEKEAMSEWIKDSTKDGMFERWSVIVAGKRESYNKEKTWILPNGFKVGKIDRSRKMNLSLDSINIGTLVSKSDLVADLKEEDFKDFNLFEKLKKKSDLSNSYSKFRDASEKNKSPLLVIYRVDKDSIYPTSENDKSDRVKLNAPADLIGFAFVFPGVRKSSNKTTRVKIATQNEDEKGEEA